MNFTTNKSAAGFAAAIIVAACAPSRTRSPVPAPVPVPVTVAKAPLPPANPKLPAVPDVHGPLQVKVVYPPAGSFIEARDSNFVFGSVGDGDAALSVNGVLAPVWPNGSFMAWLPVPVPVAVIDSTGKESTVGRYELAAVVGSDTSWLTHTIRLPPPAAALSVTVRDTLVPVAQPTFATLGPRKTPAALRGTESAKCFGAITSCALATAIQGDSDRIVIGRPTPSGTYKWFLIPGTTVRILGTQGEFSKVELDSDQLIWIASSDMSVENPTAAPAPITIGQARIDPTPEWIDVVIPSSAPPAFLVEQNSRSLILTLYGVSAPASALRDVVSKDPYVAAVQASGAAQRIVITVDLSASPYGYLSLYQNGQFTLRLRRPPTVDAALPLRGLTIAVDPGHPPIGATGPTGLWEPHATLEVGFRLRDMLIASGANVVMTRTAHEDVDLSVRPTVARRNNAHAFVSIHLNALPNGTNPFTHHGTSTYWFHPHSTQLAQTVQRGLLAEMGLSDIGVRFGNFAVIRGTWMPSVLAEGAFIMMPDQEAAMRTVQYQEQYARGIVLGLEDFFRNFVQQK